MIVLGTNRLAMKYLISIKYHLRIKKICMYPIMIDANELYKMSSKIEL